MIGQDTADRTLQLVRDWNPREAYGHEREFQKELSEYLDEQLNQGNTTGSFESHDYVVSREHGRSNGDVVVDDSVGIELKRDLSNSQTKKLDGQIRSYRKEYDFVIVCACGIDDMSGWRRLKNNYRNQGLNSLDQQTAPVEFVHKKKEHFGNSGTSNSSRRQSGGGAASGTSGEQLADEIDVEEIVQDGVKGVKELTTDTNTNMSKVDAILATAQLGILVVIFAVFAVAIVSVLL